jgi:hypothetical protein
MEKWLIQGENAPNCHKQTSSPLGLMHANLNGESLGTGLLIEPDFPQKSTQKRNKNMLWTVCKHSAKALRKVSLKLLGGILQG